MSSEKTFFERCVELSADAAAFVGVTFVSSKGSAPQDAGSKMIVTANGLDWGTIGGGKIEARAIEEARAMLGDTTASPDASSARTRLIDWDLGNDLGMTCGGSVRLLFEAHNTDVWDVAIFGAGHVAQALVPILLSMSCRVMCVDARPEWLGRLPQAAGVRPVETDDPASAMATLPGNAYVLCLTPGHENDFAVLKAAFESGLPFPYVGCIGSKTKAATMRKALLDSGVSQAFVESLHCPVGLPIGTNAPAEIAISIAAQMLQERDRLRAERG